MCKSFWIGCIVLGFFATTGFGQPPVQKPIHAKWEYRVLNHEEISKLGKANFSVGLNELGKEGWELAGLQPGRENITGALQIPAVFYFKRPVGNMPVLKAKPALPDFNPGPGVKAKVEFNVITLKRADVGEMVKVLKDIFQSKGTLTITAHLSSNSLIVAGPQEELFEVQALVTRLEDAIADKKAATPVLPKKTDEK